MPCVKSTWWVFTINNPTERLVFDKTRMQYLLYQLEEGELKTCHYQGVCQFLDKNTSLKKAKDVLGERAHCEPMRAKNPLDAIDYCRKEKGRLDGPWEHGELLLRRSNKRKLAKLEEEYDANPEEFKLKNPDLANRIRVKRFTDEWFSSSGDRLEDMNRPWQLQLRRELQKEPDRRTIHWVVGRVGGEGKTTFASALEKAGWAYIRPRTLADMTYLYVDQGVDKHLVVDVTRRVEPAHYDAIYQLVEDVKDRKITSTKYRPISGRMVNNVHVVVFSNHPCSDGKLSGNRLCHHDLDTSDAHLDPGDLAEEDVAECGCV